MRRKKKNQPKTKPKNPKSVVLASDEQARQQGFDDAVKAEVEKQIVGNVNWKWRTVILAIMNGAENYQAYNRAYKIGDVEHDKKAYMVAAASSARLLKNVKFRKYWRDLLEEQGFNNDVVDTEMLKLITDPSTPANVRRATIRDYNELQGRIIRRTDVTSDDKPIPILGLAHEIPKE